MKKDHCDNGITVEIMNSYMTYEFLIKDTNDMNAPISDMEELLSEGCEAQGMFKIKKHYPV